MSNAQRFIGCINGIICKDITRSGCSLELQISSRNGSKNVFRSSSSASCSKYSNSRRSFSSCTCFAAASTKNTYSLGGYRYNHSVTSTIMSPKMYHESLNFPNQCYSTSTIDSTNKNEKYVPPGQRPSTSTGNSENEKDMQLAYTTYPGKKDSSMVDTRKRPILIAHGLFGARGNFHSVCKQLSKNGRMVIPFDARNHGDSEHSSDMNYTVMGQDLVGLQSDLKLSQPVILGHSMGGKAAMTAALTQPEAVSSLIVGDVAPQRSPGILALRDIAVAMRNVTLTPGLSLVKARTQARIQLASAVQERPVLEFLLTNLREMSPQNIKWRVNLDAIIDNIDQLADMPGLDSQPFTKPTLFVFGEKSDHYKNADLDLIKSLFPAVQIEVIPGAGHFIHAEKPLEFVEIVNDFVRKLDS